MTKIGTTLCLFLFPAMTAIAQTSQEPGINKSFMNLETPPAQDFYRFVSGNWLDQTAIPPDRTRWGSADELRQKTDRDVLAILKEASGNPKYKPNTDQGKAIALYQSIMDTVTRNKHGLQPLMGKITRIDAVRNVADLARLLAAEESFGGIGFFNFGIGADEKNSNRYVVELGPARLGLPDRDYYVSDEKDPKEKREKYRLHVAKMLQFLGQDANMAQRSANQVLALETALASASLTRVERRDSRNTYNPMSIQQVQQLVPSIDWKSYFAVNGITRDSVIVTQPRYMAALEGILRESNVEDWKAYMRWTALNAASAQLSTDIENANFEFYGKTMTGALKQRPRDERALQVVNARVGEALGKLYVEKKFPAAAKAKAELMIRYVFRAFETRINNLTWMSAQTRKSAIAKIRQSRIKVGYPDQWRDYSALAIKSPSRGGTLYDNMRAAAQWRSNEQLRDLPKPVDKNRWYMSPQTVNAYYNPSFNEIVFPAAILQPPYYNYQADEAVNFGAIGGVIGHEISHGFDDSGSRYNAEGNLSDWWTEEDLDQFTQLTAALANQYSALQPLPGIFVDGKFTLGENIGDLGGINAAYDGLQLYLKDHGRPGLIDGFTPEQRFFISWSTMWRTKMRDEALKNQIKTDPHSPGMYRAYVPLQNIDAFYDAFQIKPGDGMYLAPEKRVKIW